MTSPKSRVVQIIFYTLVLDLLAFTIPLPLFPRIVEWYTLREGGSSSNTLLSHTLSLLQHFRGTLISYGNLEPVTRVGNESVKKWDIVLLGGALGSVFSFCQYLIAPYIGKLSDRYGRRPVLLASMLGNIASTVIWLQSTTFISFLLARLVGGLSEGNVQISIACLSDVTSPSTRGRALALVGLAFSICFTFGPSLGAYFASQPVPSAIRLAGRELNIYASAAGVALVLLVLETVVLYWMLPETKGWVVVDDEGGKEKTDGDEKKEKKVVASLEERKRMLAKLMRLHRNFLFFFSGAEFTLSFLTFDLFSFSNAQNGRVLGFIGVLSSLLQGGYTRRLSVSARPLALAYRGILVTSLGLLLLSSLPSLRSLPILYAAAACLAFTSASVVTGLNSMASLLCDDEEKGEGESTVVGKVGREERLLKGKTLGQFRSAGQLGRALGPIFCCSIYFISGPFICYALSGTALSAIAWRMRPLVREERRRAEGIKVD